MKSNNSKKSNSNSKKQDKKQEKKTVEVLQLQLDVKQNHSMRKRLESEGCDAMALHSFDKLSKAYIAQCLALAKAGKEIAGESKILFCNGVTERVSVDAASGNYSRKAGNGKAIFGNVNALSSLYGNSVTLLSDEEIKKRFTAEKEIVKRKLGDGREITGKIVSHGMKGAMRLDVVAVELGNGKFALHNLEDKSNVHQRKVNRWQALQVKTEKQEKKVEAASR